MQEFLKKLRNRVDKRFPKVYNIHRKGKDVFYVSHIKVGFAFLFIYKEDFLTWELYRNFLEVWFLTKG